MAGVTDQTVCSVCGETYWYEFNTRTGETTKLSYCLCDREMDYYREFLREKDLVEEFEEFRREKEKEYWTEWIVELFEDEVDLDELIEKLKINEDKILECMSDDDILEAVAGGVADYWQEDLEELVDHLAEWLDLSPEMVKRKILAGIL